MYINWYGQSSFKLQNKEVTILLNPYSARRAGLRGPNFKADITILSNHNQEVNQKDLRENCFLIESPGEYEIKEVFVYGWLANDKQIIYRLIIDGIRLGFLGELNSALKASEIEKLNGLDVLLVPVGGKKQFLDSSAAAKLVKTIEPQIVIPACFQISGLKNPLASVDKFLVEFGIKKYQSVDKIRLQKKDIKSEDGPEVIVLKAGS